MIDPPARSAVEHEGQTVGHLWYDPSPTWQAWKALPLGETRGMAFPGPDGRERAMGYLLGQWARRDDAGNAGGEQVQ